MSTRFIRPIQSNILRSGSQYRLAQGPKALSSIFSSPIKQAASFHQSSSPKMKVARVVSWGSPPEYMDAPDLPAPSADQIQLKVLATGVPRVVKARAAAKHPSAFNQALPYDPSIDGVGLDESTGDKYFINGLAAPLFSERANVDRKQLVKLHPNADPVNIAAMANPAVSSWLALQCRAVGGCKGRTVAILGATSASGRAAVFIARELGAEKIVGISRSADSLATVQGLDERVVLNSPLALPPSVGPVDIVLDYVGGPVSVELMRAVEIKKGENLQYIIIGGLAGEENLVLPARILNTRPIRLMSSGIGSVTKEELDRETPAFIEAISRMERPFEVFAAPMADVQTVWESEEAQNKRMVLVP